VKPIVFRRKRAWKELFGCLFMTLCAAGMLLFFAYGVYLTALGWICAPMKFYLVMGISTIGFLMALVVGVPVMLIGVVFFGGCFLDILKEFFLINNMLEVLPSGISGKTNACGVDFIPWECIASVCLETQVGRTVIGIQTTAWPPNAVWKRCSGDTRRMLWKRHHRRQTPFWFYIDDAAASPETILHTIQQELERARQRGLASREPEEGGT